MKISKFRECLLRDVLLFPETTDTFSNGRLQAAPHTGIVGC